MSIAEWVLVALFIITVVSSIAVVKNIGQSKPYTFGTWVIGLVWNVLLWGSIYVVVTQ